MSNLENFKDFQFPKFQRNSFWKMRKLCNLETSKNVQFKKLKNNFN